MSSRASRSPSRHSSGSTRSKLRRSTLRIFEWASERARRPLRSARSAAPRPRGSGPAASLPAVRTPTASASRWGVGGEAPDPVEHRGAQVMQPRERKLHHVGLVADGAFDAASGHLCGDGLQQLGLARSRLAARHRRRSSARLGCAAAALPARRTRRGGRAAPSPTPACRHRSSAGRRRHSHMLSHTAWLTSTSHRLAMLAFYA